MTSKAYREGYNRIDWSQPLPQRERKTFPMERSSLPLPFVVRSFAEPVKSMADGKMYEDPASLRASYKAANNPHGIDFIEVGNEDITKFERPKKDRKGQRDAIERAINDVANGNAPPLLTTDQRPL